MFINSGISVIVCTHNGVQRLRPTLVALFTQQISDNVLWEIIIVDNASTDDTRRYCEQLVKEYNFNGQFKLIDEDKPGLNYARQRGLQAANYDWILFCDDDNHLFPDYLQTGFNLIRSNKNIGVLGGCGLPVFEQEPPTWFEKYSHSFAVGKQHINSGQLPGPVAEVYGAGAFILRQPLLDFFRKGFQTITTDRKGNSLASGGDVEWCYISQLAGYDIWYCDDLKFYHSMPPGRLTWEYYLRLKNGIASSAALLYTYHVLLQQPKLTMNGFRVAYLGESAFRVMVWLKHALLEKASDVPEKKLASTIIESKAKSFLNSYGAASKHFAQIKKFKIDSL